jgi:dihydrofolate reductase
VPTSSKRPAAGAHLMGRVTYEGMAAGWPTSSSLGLSAPLHLELVEATTYATGPAIHVYRPRSRSAAA